MTEQKALVMFGNIADCVEKNPQLLTPIERELIAALLRSLTYDKPECVPDGYQLVPEQMTPEMRWEMSTYIPLHFGALDYAYEAALKAAPTTQEFKISQPQTSNTLYVNPH
jgi:hypothetical protein